MGILGMELKFWFLKEGERKAILGDNIVVVIVFATLTTNIIIPEMKTKIAGRCVFWLFAYNNWQRFITIYSFNRKVLHHSLLPNVLITILR